MPSNRDYHTTLRAHIKAVRVRHRIKPDWQEFVPCVPESLLAVKSVAMAPRGLRSYARQSCCILPALELSQRNTSAKKASFPTPEDNNWMNVLSPGGLTRRPA